MDTENWTIGQKHEKICETKIISEGQSQPTKPVIRNGPVIAKIPVVISQTKVHIHIESKVCLDRYSVGIQDFTREIYVANCNLLDLGNKKCGKMYLKGFIRESIEYLDAECISDGERSRSIRCTVVKIPFDCCAKVYYCMPPRIKTGNRLIPVEVSNQGRLQRDHIVSSLLHCRGSDFDILGGNAGCQGLSCEVEEAEVQQADIIKETSMDGNINSGENAFDTFIEHMSMSIELTLLQKQFVSIPKYSNYLY